MHNKVTILRLKKPTLTYFAEKPSRHKKSRDFLIISVTRAPAQALFLTTVRE